MKTYRTRTNRRAFTIMAAIGTLTASVAAANDSARSTSAATAKVAVTKARVGRSMHPDHAFVVKMAFKVAVKRIEKSESCRGLFDDLVFDGLQALDQSRYHPPQSQWEQRQCAAGIAAYTVVGSNRVVVCRHFQRLDRRVQSAVLIHEALHTAGLSEAPLDPDAMTAVEIEAMVEDACGLKR